ncbi:MAG TPA: magnesium transporter [Pirellulaceae bacterium]
MVNTLFLPELREMLADNNVSELQEFCEALHPARAADFMDGLTADEAWRVLTHASLDRRVEIFGYFELPKQVEIVESEERSQIAELISQLAPDDRVDLLHEVNPTVVEELLPLLPSEARRDILHLRSYAEGTAGAMMTTNVAMLPETLTVREALDQLQHIAEGLETIYYLYIVNEANHLRGLVSARQLLSSIGRPQTPLSEIMETGLVTAEVDDDQEEVAEKVARYDLLAIPVVDAERTLLGIITYDDIIDVLHEEAVEDAHRSAAVAPLEDTYFETDVVTMAWKRGLWLTILFVGALATAFSLRYYDRHLDQWQWLVLFLPLVVSCGGNTGNQSATLIITGLTRRDIRPKDWLRVMRRELVMGLILGLFLGMCGLVTATAVCSETRTTHAMWVLPLTVMIVVVTGSLVGSLLPLAFSGVGLDPALMSNPFVAGIIDIVGIVIYLNVAWVFLAN